MNFFGLQGSYSGTSGLFAFAYLLLTMEIPPCIPLVLEVLKNIRRECDVRFHVRVVIISQRFAFKSLPDSLCVHVPFVCYVLIVQLAVEVFFVRKPCLDKSLTCPCTCKGRSLFCKAGHCLLKSLLFSMTSLVLRLQVNQGFLAKSSSCR